MEALENKAMIYDDTCPMCSLYTKGFVKWGLLENDNRIAFSSLDTHEIICRMDINRARHQIPLIDLKGGKTLYGLDALTFLLSQKIPFLRKLLHIKPVYNFFSCLYNIVSYNRRIIVPAKPFSAKIDCAPDF